MPSTRRDPPPAAAGVLAPGVQPAEGRETMAKRKIFMGVAASAVAAGTVLTRTAAQDSTTPARASTRSRDVTRTHDRAGDADPART
jgi:hypothetical protein